MPAFPQVAPPVGQTVTITLVNTETLTAEWDGLQWWVDLPDSPNRAPVVNSYVVSWFLEQ